MNRRFFLSASALTLGASAASAGTSFYAPLLEETVNLTYGPGSPVWTGQPFDMAVSCDFGQRVYMFKDGAVLWHRDYDSPRALDYFQGLLWVADGAQIISYYPLTSYPHHVWTLPTPVTGLQFTQDSTGAYLTVCSGNSAIKVYWVQDGHIRHYFTNPYSVSYPRSAYVDGGWLFVADTFGQRVYAVDIASRAMRFEIPVVFPNYIEPTDNPEEVRITAEHSNRVLLYNYITDQLSVELTCPIAPFPDPDMRADQIWPFLPGTAAPGVQPTKSLCATEHAGADTLYSPNSARFYPGIGYLVADTDNHRVVMFDPAGQIVSEVTGFNNPVNAVLIPET